MKATLQRQLKVGSTFLKTTEQIAEMCQKKGRDNVCHFMSYAKCIKIDSDLETESGLIMWICEDGTLISENGYHYNINCFI